MKKTIFIFIVGLAFLFFTNNAFAYPGGLLDGQRLLISRATAFDNSYLWAYSSTPYLTDNNAATSEPMNPMFSGKDFIHYVFNVPMDINSFVISKNNSYRVNVRFYDKNNVLLNLTPVQSTSPTNYYLNAHNVYRVILERASTAATSVKEFDVFGSPVPHDDINGLNSSTDYKSASLSWSNPVTNPDFTGVKIYRNGSLITTLDKVTNYTDAGLAQDTNYTYKIVATYNDGYETSGVSKTVKTDKLVHDELSDLNISTDYKSASLSWTFPNNQYFTGVKLYRDGSLIKTLGKVNSYTDSNLTNDKNYTYKMTAVYLDGFETSGITKTAKTDSISNVIELKANPSFDRIDLSWILPEQNGFKKVVIYRDEVNKGWFGSVGNTVYAASTAIFETNGTYFNDLTVSPEKKYEYTVKTVTDDGLKSDGASITVETTKEPVPQIVDGIYKKTPIGDYEFSWSQPTDGQVKILINGQEYKTIDASLLKILIPKNDMKYDYLGNPKVTLIPIARFGTQGPTTPFKPLDANSGVAVPFSVNDLIGTGVNLLWLVGPFLLIALALLLVPKLRKLIFGSFGKNGKASAKAKEKNETGRRFQASEPDIKDQQVKVQLERQEKEQWERKQRKEKEYFAKLERQEITSADPVIRTPKASRETHIRSGKLSRMERAAREPRQPRIPRERNRPTRPPRAGRER